MADRWEVGDRVVKDPAAWVPSEFDAWGAGEGIGEVVGVVEDGPAGALLDVRWEGGQCYQWARELRRADGAAR